MESSIYNKQRIIYSQASTMQSSYMPKDAKKQNKPFSVDNWNYYQKEPSEIAVLKSWLSFLKTGLAFLKLEHWKHVVLSQFLEVFCVHLQRPGLMRWCNTKLQPHRIVVSLDMSCAVSCCDDSWPKHSRWRNWVNIFCGHGLCYFMNAIHECYTEDSIM